MCKYLFSTTLDSRICLNKSLMRMCEDEVTETNERLSGVKQWGTRKGTITRLRWSREYDLSSNIFEVTLQSFILREWIPRSIAVTNRLLFMFFSSGYLLEHPEFRVVLQLHHVHGGEQRRSDSVGAEFSSQNARQIRDAIVGKRFALNYLRILRINFFRP